MSNDAPRFRFKTFHDLLHDAHACGLSDEAFGIVSAKWIKAFQSEVIKHAIMVQGLTLGHDPSGDHGAMDVVVPAGMLPPGVDRISSATQIVEAINAHIVGNRAQGEMLKSEQMLATSFMRVFQVAAALCDIGEAVKDGDVTPEGKVNLHRPLMGGVYGDGPTAEEGENEKGSKP